jgi:nitrate reductase beta subunit
MRIERIQTRHGGFIEIVLPDDFDFDDIEMPTGDDMIAAAMRYMSKIYLDASQRIAVATTFTNVAMASYAETLDILNDPEAMAAIEEAKQEGATE